MFQNNHYKVSQRVRAWKNIGVFGLLLAVLVAIFAAQVSAQSLNYTTSWLGNSYGGNSPTNATPKQHVQDDIMGLYVAPNGACYTDSSWDENGGEGGYDAAIYNTNNSHSLDGFCQDLNAWGRNGSRAITSDGTYLYVAITQTGDEGADSNNNKYGMPDYPSANTVWYAVRRYNLNGTPAPFTGGAGWDGSMLVVAQGTRPAPVPNQPGQPYSGSQIAGLAVASGYLYVSDPNSNKILQYSLAGGGLARTALAGFNSSASLTVGTMTAANSSGGPFLWVNERNSGGCVLIAYGLSGGQVAGANPPAGTIPSALAYNSANNTLYVADAGPDQNIKAFSLSSGTWSTPFGVTGGQFDSVHAAVGTVGPQRFNNITGLGIDSSGNLYVAEDETCFFPSTAGSGGSVLESYNLLNGSRNWELHGLTFVDCADIDPATGTDAYTKDKHFTMNWGSTAPGSEATYAGYTLNRFRYPQDLRLHLGATNASEAWMREYVDGNNVSHRFLITHDMFASTLGIFRFNPSTDGQTAIPSVVFSQHNINPSTPAAKPADVWPEGEPGSGEWLWTFTGFGINDGTMNSGTYQANPNTAYNPNAWGWWVDNRLNVWQATQGGGIREWVCQGLDSIGNPIYNYAHLTTYPMPPPFQSLQRTEYHAETDTMYLAGYNAAYPNSNNDWGILGTVIYRYDHWSSNPAVHPGYPIVLPYSDSASPQILPASMSATGSYVFVTLGHTNEILVYNADTGAQVGTITPGADVGGTGSNQPLGWTDIRNGVRAYQISNGEYEIFNEDDTYGKTVMYRWTPFVQLQNRWQGTYINIENDLACSSIWGGELSAEWIQEPASSSGAFRLRNRLTSQYLNVTTAGALQCTAASTSSTATQWLLQADAYNDGFVNLASVFDGQYINNENNPSVPACTAISPAWYSAMWTLNNVNN